MSNLFGEPSATDKYLSTGAIMDQTRTYRYVLWRTWDLSKPVVIYIGLNPSTADEHADDATIKKEVRFAKRWGMGGIVKLNLFPFRATVPADMKRAYKNGADIIGDCDYYLCRYVRQGAIVVAAWGCDGGFLERGEHVRQLLQSRAPLHYLKLTKDGHPQHPLYLKETTVPQLWE